jgi:hypothetical protein
MFHPILIARFLAVGAMSLWIGGFTFYGGIVIPILHEFMTTSEAGEVTRRVTDALNLIGLVTVVVWSVLLVVERNQGSGWAKHLRILAFGGAAGLLAGQGILHEIMDARLDAGSIRGFYPFHRVYLGASTLQWGLNLFVLYLSLILWDRRDSRKLNL